MGSVMSDARKKLQGAFARENAPTRSRDDEEADARQQAETFIEQTLIPGFQAAADAIQEDSSREVEVFPGPTGAYVVTVEFIVRDGGEVQFFCRAVGDLVSLPISWRTEISPVIEKNGRPTRSKNSKRKVPWTDATTPEQISDYLMNQYAPIVEAYNRFRGWR